MQKNSPVNLHKSKKLFSNFERDMEILPSYTPIFLVDGRGRIVESRKLRMLQNGYLNVVSEVCRADKEFFISAYNKNDAFAVEASFGEGKDFIVISKDNYGFSRCVVCSLSDNNCMHLHEYYEKLSCYKDYLDSFSSLMFSSFVRTPVMRLFRMRMNGAAELLRLSEGRVNERTLTFCLGTAMEKLCDVAKAMHGDEAINIYADDVIHNIVLSAPESFFKLVLCLVAFGIRCSNDKNLYLSAKESENGNFATVILSVKSASVCSQMYKRTLENAFERSGFSFDSEDEDGNLTFSFVAALAGEKEKVLSDSALIVREIEAVLSQDSVQDMYRAVADI